MQNPLQRSSTRSEYNFALPELPRLLFFQVAVPLIMFTLHGNELTLVSFVPPKRNQWKYFAKLYVWKHKSFHSGIASVSCVHLRFTSHLWMQKNCKTFSLCLTRRIMLHYILMRCSFLWFFFITLYSFLKMWTHWYYNTTCDITSEANVWCISISLPYLNQLYPLSCFNHRELHGLKIVYIYEMQKYTKDYLLILEKKNI